MAVEQNDHCPSLVARHSTALHGRHPHKGLQSLSPIKIQSGAGHSKHFTYKYLVIARVQLGYTVKKNFIGLSILFFFMISETKSCAPVATRLRVIFIGL